MEAPNISHIFWDGPFLDGLDFLRVHLDPISTNNKPEENYIIYTKSTLLYISIESVFPKDWKNLPEMS